jgi:hypothetical protein
MPDQMKPPVIWDTDVTSLSIRQQLPRPLKHKLVGTKPVMTFVTFGELVSWVKLRDLGREKTGVIYSWLDKTPFLPGDEAVNVKDFHDFSVHHGLELITA